MPWLLHKSAGMSYLSIINGIQKSILIYMDTTQITYFSISNTLLTVFRVYINRHGYYTNNLFLCHAHVSNILNNESYVTIRTSLSLSLMSANFL